MFELITGMKKKYLCLIIFFKSYIFYCFFLFVIAKVCKFYCRFIGTAVHSDNLKVFLPSYCQLTAGNYIFHVSVERL